MKKQYFLVLDVETANSTNDALTYDVGFVVCDRKGQVYEGASYVVTDIFDEESELMETAYYAKKLPQYHEGLKVGEFTRANFYTVRNHIKTLIEKYDATVCAYNASFDVNALNTTQRWLTKSKYRYFLPYGTKVHCIWHMACQLICTQKGYVKFCLENGFISPSGNIKTSAEAVYAYMHKDEFFEESHTGFQDVVIETEILAHCFRQHKPFKKNINRWCWRIPQKKVKEMRENGEI